eukprot:6199669-Pleurochrysis_carterae.AAC.3
MVADDSTGSVLLLVPLLGAGSSSMMLPKPAKASANAARPRPLLLLLRPPPRPPPRQSSPRPPPPLLAEATAPFAAALGLATAVCGRTFQPVRSALGFAVRSVPKIITAQKRFSIPIFSLPPASLTLGAAVWTVFDTLKILSHLLARVFGAVRQHPLQRRIDEVDVGAVQLVQDHIVRVTVEQGLAKVTGLDVEVLVSVLHAKFLVGAQQTGIVLAIVQQRSLNAFEVAVGIGGSIAGDAMHELAAGRNAWARQRLAGHAVVAQAAALLEGEGDALPLQK